MSYTFEKISSNKVKLTITIAAEEFDSAMNKAYLKNRGRINVPGFRKGKAPRKVIENMYGEGVFYDDAFDACFPAAYTEAVKAENLKVVDQPEVNIESIGAGKDMVAVCEVFVRPDVTLGAYKDLAVEVDTQVVSDADVDARISQDQMKASREVEVLDRPVEEGDTVNLNYAGSVDGVAFEGGTAENQTLTIGSHQFIPGFEEQMVGMSVAEEKDLEVTFPTEYHAENLAGKAAVFHVKVNSITKTEKPELDDEFAADVSDFTTFAEYRQSIVDQLNEQAVKNNKIAAENAVVEMAVANATVEIPEAMVKDQVNNMLREMEMRMSYQGLRMQDFLKYTGQTIEQLGDSYKGEAEKRVKIELVLEAIRAAESVEPTEEEVNAQIAEFAERMGREVEEIEKSLTEEQRTYLTDTAAVQKTVDLMMATAKVTDKPATEAAAE